MSDFLLELQFGMVDVFFVSGDDTYAYRILFMYVHGGGGAWMLIFQGALQNASRQLSPGEKKSNKNILFESVLSTVCTFFVKSKCSDYVLSST